MPVSTTHPNYDYTKLDWQFVRDCVKGQRAVKDRGTQYLPATWAKEDPDRYDQYIKRAYFMGVTGRTQAALTGMVFRKPYTAELPPRIEEMAEIIDGSGQSLEQLAKAVINDLLVTGRYGLLTDYPQAQEGMDAETEARLGLRPIVASYPAESIINWQTDTINGRKTVTLVVLKEEQNASIDEYGHETETVYRVLRLRDGVYTQALYNDEGEAITEEYTPRQAGGAVFDHIPFHFAGAEDNYPDPDIAPLLDMAHINIAQYQSTAELKENQYFSAQGTLHLDTGEMNSQEFQALNPNGVVVGRRTGIVTSGGGRAELLQGDSRQADILETIKHEEQQMVAIGARLVQRGAQAETAEAARLNASAEASTLDGLVSNASEAIEASLEDMARFSGENPEGIEFQLNTEFWDVALGPQDLQAIQAGVGTLYGAADALEMIRAGRVYLRDNRTNDQIMQDAASTLLDGEIDRLAG